LDSFRGLSIRQLYTNLVVDLIFILYFLDHSEETNFTIFISAIFAPVPSLWKIYKVSTFKKKEKFPYFTYDHSLHTDHETSEYDRIATNFMLKSLVPCYIVYIIYSIIYEKHVGWYRFVLSSVVGFIYMFGNI